MMIMKTAAAAALVAVAALATGGAPAEAHGKKGVWSKHQHIHHYGFKHRPYYGPRIVVGTSYYGCGRWLHRYKATGKKKYLSRYYACTY